MRIGALADTGFPKPAFWFLLLGCTIAATLVWRRDPAQRSIQDASRCLLRVIVGTMWWQQSLWKVPPHYDWGLIHWMEEMVEHASIELQSDLVRDLVLPNIAVFGPLVYAIEVGIAVSLILGLLTRVGALLGALMAINLWLGLYNAPSEWPWTYMFLVVIQLIYLIDPPGRSLGVDALLWRRRGTSPEGATLLSFVPEGGEGQATRCEDRSGQIAGECFQRPQRVVGSLRFALLEILTGKTHGVGDLSETKHRFVLLAGKRIERGSFHFDGENSLERAAAIASAVSRNGASVVQLGPTWAETPASCNARFAAAIRPGSASAKTSGAA